MEEGQLTEKRFTDEELQILLDEFNGVNEVDRRDTCVYSRISREDISIQQLPRF